MVAIHREVAPHNAGHPPGARLHAPALDRLQIVHALGRRGVAPVGEAVQNEVLGAEVCGQLDQRTHVLELGVHASV